MSKPAKSTARFVSSEHPGSEHWLMQTDLVESLHVSLGVCANVISRPDQPLTLIQGDRKLQLIGFVADDPDRVHRFVLSGSDADKPDQRQAVEVSAA